ncbi:MAG TPA: WYL domain-containing protein [Luteibaculaceae bacterium]|nr:WYL domain-containing protein [Luteibaculaceae bacterium]
MPRVKNALLRHKIIEERLKNTFRPYPSLEELRQCCEEKLYGSVGSNICISTIEKDLRDMRMEYDAPIKFHRLHHGYYLEDPNYSSDLMPLTDDETEAIRFAALTLQQYKNISVFSQFQHAIGKIVERITISERMEDADIQKLVQFETQPNIPGSDWLTPLFRCIKNRIPLSVVYHSYASDQVKKYQLHPYVLKEYKYRWYLVAYDLQKSAVRTFELGRIQHIEPQEGSFAWHPEFDAGLFFKHAFGVTVTKGEPHHVRLRFDKSEWRYLKDTPLHHTQQRLLEDDTHVEIGLHVYLTVELEMAILSYGNKVQVMEPATLATRIAADRASGGGKF